PRGRAAPGGARPVSVDMSPAAISARLSAVGRLSDLRADRRLYYKLDLRPDTVSRRLRELGRLSDLCVRLGRPAPGAPDPLERLRVDVAALDVLLRGDAGAEDDARAATLADA